MNNTKKDYIIKEIKPVSYINADYYLTAFNELGFLGSSMERNQAKRFTYDEAVQACYEVCRKHNIHPSKLKIIKR